MSDIASDILLMTRPQQQRKVTVSSKTPRSDGKTTGKRGKRAHSGTLDVALLGLLADEPMHGYQLRAQLKEIVGTVRSYSYGSLYPALRRLEAAALIVADQPPRDPDAVPLSPKRTRVTYRITAAGKEHLEQLLEDAGPTAWSDEGFGVHLALFPKTAVEARLRILRGRRRRVEERREGLRSSLARAAAAMDDYTLELQRLAMEASDREVKWLSDIIDREERRSGKK